MKFVCEPSLREYMKQKNRTAISVEVASSDHSDFEVTELFLRLLKPDFADYLVSKKRYRRYPMEGGGEVLLPPYRLEYDEIVTFGRKKGLVFYRLTMEGIRL